VRAGNASSFVGVVRKLDYELIGIIPLSINQSHVIFAVSVWVPSPEREFIQKIARALPH
jgi:hypothetical protein